MPKLMTYLCKFGHGKSSKPKNRKSKENGPISDPRAPKISPKTPGGGRQSEERVFGICPRPKVGVM